MGGGHREGPIGLIEREAELAELDRSLAAAVAGKGRLLVIGGPAGIGKTALLGVARERSERAGMLAVAARGGELEGLFPYGVVRQLFEPVLRAASDARRAQLLDGAAALAAPIALGSEPTALPSDPGLSVLHGLYWLVANLATEAPLTVLIDDLQWSDPPSRRFVAYLARRLAGLPVCVIASLRTGEPGSEFDRAGELAVDAGISVTEPLPLSHDGVASILLTALEQEADDEFVIACHRVTGGNPFLLKELAASLKTDQIQPTAGALGKITTVGPKAVAWVTLTRLSHLSEGAVAFARAMAVLGPLATLRRAAALSGLDERSALAARDALIATDVVRADARLEFKHPIVRTAIYGEMAPGVRSDAHQRLASLLVADGAELDAIAGQLMLTEPMNSVDTIGTLRDAAAHALTVGAPDSAAAYLSRALEEGYGQELRIELLLELAQAEKLAGQPGAAAHFEEASQSATDPAMRAVAMIELAEMQVFDGQWDQPLSLLDDALSVLGDREPTLALRASTMLLIHTAYDPRLVEHLERRLPALRTLAGSGEPVARILAMALAGPLALRGEPSEDVCALVERGWDEGRFLADGGPIVLLPQGLCALVIGDQLDRATELVQALQESASNRGSVLEFVIAGVFAAWIESRAGSLAIAEAELRSACERALEWGVTFALPTLLWYGMEVLTERPETADLAAIAEAIELGPMAEVGSGGFLFLARGHVRLAVGDRTGAIADLRRAGTILSGLSFINPNGATWRSALALALAPDQLEEGLELAHAELTDARQIGQPRGIGVALRVLGTIEREEGVRRGHLLEAVSVLDGSPARLEHARALVELGALLRRQGRRAEAREPLREGLDIAVRCGAIRLTERARAELAATGARPRRELISGRDALTPSELRVARLAAEGRMTREIAQALFLSTKTVDSHLNHCYLKLGINSRRQLAGALEQEAS